MNNKVVSVFVEALVELTDVSNELVESGLLSEEVIEKLKPLLAKANYVLDSTYSELEKM